MLRLSKHAQGRLRERWPYVNHANEIGAVEKAYRVLGDCPCPVTVISGNGVPFVIKRGFVLTVLPRRKRR